MNGVPVISFHCLRMATCTWRSHPFLEMSPKGFEIRSRSVSQCKPCKTFPIKKVTIRFYILTQASLVSISQVRNKICPRGYRCSTISSTPIQTVATLRSFIISLAARVWLLNLPRKACVASRSGPAVPFEPSPLPDTRCSCRTMV